MEGLLHGRADRLVLLVLRETAAEDVAVVDLLAPEDPPALVEADLEAAVRLPEVLDLDVELPALALDGT